MTGSEKRMLKSATLVSLMTALSRIMGLVREQLRSFFLGTGMAADALALAGAIPNMFRRLLAEGAMTAAFLPVFTDYVKTEEDEEVWRFVGRFLTLFTFLLTSIVLLGIVLTPVVIDLFFSSRFSEVVGKIELTVLLTKVMFPYLFLVSLAAIAQAILNTYRVFVPSAFTPVLLNVAIIGTVILFHDSFATPAHAFAVGFLVGGTLQLAFQLPFLKRQGFKLRLSFAWRHPGVRKVFRVFAPGVFAAGIFQINVMVSQVIASTLDQGAISSLLFSLRLQELVLGVVVVSITTVILPTMAEQAVEGRLDGLKRTLVRANNGLFFVTIPATCGLILIRTPLVRLLFQQGVFDERSTQLTTFALLFHAAGLLPVGLSRVVTQAFYAHKDLKTPTLIAAVVMVVHAVACFALAVPLAHGGVALASTIAALMTCVMLYVVFRRRYGPPDEGSMFRSLVRSCVATVLMGAAVYGLSCWLGVEEIRGKWALGLHLAILLAVAVAVYVAAHRCLRSPELTQLLNLFRRRTQRKSEPE